MPGALAIITTSSHSLYSRPFCVSYRDNVEWDEEQEEAALKAIEKQSRAPISPEEQGQTRPSALLLVV